MERPLEHRRTSLMLFAAFVMFALLGTAGSALALPSGSPKTACAGLRPYSDLHFSPGSCATPGVSSLRPFMDSGAAPGTVEVASRKPLSDLAWRPSGTQPAIAAQPAPVSPVPPSADRFGAGLRLGLIVGLIVAILAAILTSRQRRVRPGVPA